MTRPADDPQFFRSPPPPGRSRESTIRLDGEGHFQHDGDPFAHAKLASAMHKWIGRHPDDRRYILNNGYDWSYFTVEDAPYFVRHLVHAPEAAQRTAPVLSLSDETEEQLVAERTFVAPDGALYTQIKREAPDGPYWAKFTRHAQTELAPYLTEVSGSPALAFGGRVVTVGSRDVFE
ncbi:MAG: hypothetical protein HOO96_18535 [Polyangiaceae bacterium]|nr:hypothetical protein [Polyangiaceae bacterium]